MGKSVEEQMSLYTVMRKTSIKESTITDFQLTGSIMCIK